MTIHHQFRATMDAAIRLVDPPAAFACAAPRSPDQPTIQGDSYRNDTNLHSKFLKSGVAKSLTRSVRLPSLRESRSASIGRTVASTAAPRYSPSNAISKIGSQSRAYADWG
jgi:hypothetical protein